VSRDVPQRFGNYGPPRPLRRRAMQMHTGDDYSSSYFRPGKLCGVNLHEFVFGSNTDSRRKLQKLREILVEVRVGENAHIVQTGSHAGPRSDAPVPAALESRHFRNGVSF
jgi:hypothetical protein